MVKLILPQKDFESLHDKADSRASRVTVDRESLARLLIDHGQALQALKSHHIEYKEPEGGRYATVTLKPKKKKKVKIKISK